VQERGRVRLPVLVRALARSGDDCTVGGVGGRHVTVIILSARQCRFTIHAQRATIRRAADDLLAG